MRYYQFHIGDYRSGTDHLSDEEDLAYRRLLDLYYDTEEPLPNDLPQISRRIRFNERSTTVERVLKEFFELTQKGWINARAEREIRGYKRLKDVASRAGKASVEAKKAKKLSEIPTTVEQPLNDRSTNQEPVTSNHEPIKDLNPLVSPATRPPDYTESFAQFWAIYPRHVAKQAALKAWKKVAPQNGLVETILQAVRVQRSGADWQRDDGQYIPHPATWLNQHRWEDEPAAKNNPKRQVAL